MITLKRFRRIELALQRAGYGADNAWAQAITPPQDADAFAKAAVYVIANSGMRYSVAQGIYAKCMAALSQGVSVRTVFGHPGKAASIDRIWADRNSLFEQYSLANDKLAFCASLPWVGPVTSYHLAKDLGIDVAKPDVHLERLAQRDRTTVARMCARLARMTGYRVATIDTLLWRACATGILDSRAYEARGWRSAFRGTPKIEH